MNSMAGQLEQVEYLPFEETKAFVQGLGFNNTKQWKRWASSSARPEQIPAFPEYVYSKDWQGFQDFLGCLQDRKHNFRSFEDARDYIHSLGLKNTTAWNTWSKSSQRPFDIPSCPALVYKDSGWAGMKDWLGQKLGYRDFKEYVDAKKYVHQLQFKKIRDWVQWCQNKKRPKDIPFNPQLTYQNKGWKSWSDFLGPSYWKYNSQEISRNN